MSKYRPTSGVQEKDRKRFMDKVNINEETGCWEWTASTSSGGYGMFALSRTQFMAHRVSYELNVGPIPEGLTLDHTCHSPTTCYLDDHNTCPHRRCVNPDHLEPITMLENAQRGRHKMKTHCPQGHPYDEDNTMWYDGRRYCRECGRKYKREYARRKSAGAARLKAA